MKKPEAGSLVVGTTTSDTAYHCCRAPAGRLATLAVALCRTPCRISPRPWDEARQQRQDSCHRCVKRAKKLFAEEEARRTARGATVSGYIRASTDRQIDSPDVQREMLRERAAQLGLTEPLWYVDAATSGGLPLLDREAGGRLCRDLRRGDTVLVSRLDRLGRNFLDLISTIDTWHNQGISLVACDFPMVIKAGDQVCRMVVQMLATFAEYERSMIATRTREALHWRRSVGRKFSSEPPYGFSHVWDNQKQAYYRQIDEREAEICIRCVELTMQGYTQTAIADYINIEWGIRNPRAERGPSGRVRRRPHDPARIGFFRQQMIGRLVSRGLEIMQLKGIPLPEGVTTKEDLMIR